MKYKNFKRKNLVCKGISLAVIILLTIITLPSSIVVSYENTNLPRLTMSYTFTFVKPSFENIQVDIPCYTSISMPGCISMGREAGQPTMPVKFVKLLLPPKTSVKNVEVIGSPIELEIEDIDLIESPIFPYQNPVPFGMEHEEFVVDNSFYNSDKIYPTEKNEEYRIGYSHGYAMLDIALNPVQYMPNDGKIFLYPELTLRIDLEESEYVNQFYRNNPEDEKWVKSLVWNPEIAEQYTLDIPTFDYPGGLCDPEDNYDYVIITTTYFNLDYWDTNEDMPYNWQSLVDKHKEDDGLNCNLVTIQDIDNCENYHDSDPLFNDIEAHIREFCKDAYLDWDTKYILIGGDAEWIPPRFMSSEVELGVDADIYWSNLDNTFNEDHDYYWGEEGDNGFDLYSELFIGRLPCDEPKDVSNWMTKSFYYTDNDNPDYLENAGFYAGDSYWTCQSDDFIDFSAIKGTNDWLGPDPHYSGQWPTWLGFLYGFETWNNVNPSVQYNLSVKWTAEPPNSGWQGGDESSAIAGFKDAINNDHVTLISGLAHANCMYSLDVFADDWESSYHNTKPFFIHDYGCHCGDMDAVDDGVLHSMLFHSDTELAFGCVYNTGYGWGNFYCTNSSSSLQQKLFWDYFFDIASNSGCPDNWQLGKGHSWSKDAMAPTLSWDSTWRETIQCCLLFGDPAQRLKPPNAPPAVPIITGTISGEIGGEYDYTFTTTDSEGHDMHYFIDWGDTSNTDWLGPYISGQQVTLSHCWSEQGTYIVKARTKDSYSAKSDWGYLEVKMPYTYKPFWWFDNLLNRFPLLQRKIEFF